MVAANYTGKDMEAGHDEIDENKLALVESRYDETHYDIASRRMIRAETAKTRKPPTPKDNTLFIDSNGVPRGPDDPDSNALVGAFWGSVITFVGGTIAYICLYTVAHFMG